MDSSTIPKKIGDDGVTLDEYLALVEQQAEDYDRPTAIRLYHAYYKKYSEFGESRICEYIQQKLPKAEMVGIRAVLSEFGSVSDYNIGRAIKWLQQNGEAWEETLCGAYITMQAAKILREFLVCAIPAQNAFAQVCSDIQLVPTQAMYTDFCQRCRKQLQQTKWHPFLTDKWFWTGEGGEIDRLIRQWYMAYSVHIPSDLEGHVSVFEASTILGIIPERLLTWLLAHENAYTYHNGRCLINISTLEMLRDRWKITQPVMVMLKQKIAELPTKARAGAQKYVMSWLQDGKHDWILPEGTLPQQTEGVLYTTQLFAANHALDTVMQTYPAIPLIRLRDIAGMPLKELRKKVGSGAINAQEDQNGNWYISIVEFRRVAAIQGQYVAFDEIVWSCLNEFDSKFELGVHYHRNNLLDYCNENNWWGLEYVNCDEIPIDGQKMGIAVAREDALQMKDQISLWLHGYGQPNDRKFEIVIEKYSRRYPNTITQLIRYEQQVHPADKALVDMAQYLCLLLQSDLAELSDTDIERTVIEPFGQSASLASCDILTDFLRFSGYTQRRFVFARTGQQMDITAYRVKDFAVMVAHIVNDEVIRDCDLVQKAVANKKYADMWLFVALHVYASWRSTDYVRMIAPWLPYAPEEILERAQKGDLSAKEKKRIAENFIATNSLVSDVPNKTKGTSYVPKLYFWCPQSCLESFGLILAIGAAHYQMCPSANTFVNPVKHWTVVKQFFGERFLAACGNRSFSGRRANKSLMQCVEFVGREEDQLTPTVAYHLASIMRSHKLSYGELSETTDIYLRDAAFAGLTPDYVAYQMWERGVCSFVTDVMLKMCYGDRYTRLTVAQQTKAIASMGLTPVQIANTLERVQKAEDYACEVVRDVCQSSKSIEHALKQIALGRGTGKDPDGYCLCKAAGMDCRYKDRLNCMGCKYEIRTKALLLRYAVVHQGLIRANGAESETERERCMYLCRTITYPAMQEILAHLDVESTADENLLYRQLIQEVVAHGITGNSAS